MDGLIGGYFFLFFSHAGMKEKGKRREGDEERKRKEKKMREEERGRCKDRKKERIWLAANKENDIAHTEEQDERTATV